jgi:signal transduction histidine kinase/CheY-like chemotaxis protein/ligand-binding sensor domain-containing protein
MCNALRHLFHSMLRQTRANFACILIALGVSWAGMSAISAERGPSQEGTLNGLDDRFIYRIWETADGVLPTTVRSIAQTPDGYVWLSSQDGMVRFDGARAVSFSGRKSQILPSPLNGLETFAESSGRLWSSTLKGGLFSYKNDRWVEYGDAHGWKAAPASSFSESPAGEIAFVAGGRLLGFAGEKFVEIPLPKGRNAAVGSAVFSRDGALWVSIGSELWRRVGEKWGSVAGAPGTTTLARAGLDAIWMVTPLEFRRYSPAGLQRKIERSDGKPKDTLRILEDSSGNLWAGGMETGLRIWTPEGLLLRPDTAGTVLNPQIGAIFEDRERNILVGTRGAGLARFKPTSFHLALGRSGSLSGSLINTIASVGQGKVLVGTEGNGLFLVENGAEKAQIVTEDDELGIRHRVTSVISLGAGRALAAVASKGLFLIDGTTATSIASPVHVVSLVRAMLLDSSGVVWIGCEDGVATWKDGRFSPVTEPWMASLKGVRAIAEGADGSKWFAHNGGVGIRKGSTFEPFTDKAAAGNVLAISAESNGDIWLGIENKGLVRVRDSKAFLYSAEQGLPASSIGCIALAEDDVWLAGEKGLARMSRASLDAVFEGRTKRLQYRFFNRGDGLASDLFRRGYQPSFASDGIGHWWFSTYKGIAGIHPGQIARPTFEVPAIIEEIRAERELIIVTQENREDLTIPAGTKHMTVRCSVPSLSKPEFMPIEYRLEGFDPRWYATGSERVIRFYDLAPGSYRFMVRAIGADGKSVEPATSVKFTLLPLFWQTTWFRVLIVCGIAGVAALAVWQMMRFRLRMQEERLREQEERAQLQSQLQQATQVEAIGRLAGGIAHDFNNVLTSILGNAELAHMEFGENPRLKPLLDDIMNAGGRARDLVIQILTYSRRRPATLAPMDIVPAIREALGLLRSGIPATVAIVPALPEELPRVMADGSQLQRVVVNLCTNASHALGAAGGQITVRADLYTADSSNGDLPPRMLPGRYVRIAVEDNGSGMDDKTLKHIFDPFFTTKGVGKGSGLGLAVVQGIVEAHNGIITVESLVSKGTTFTIFLRVTEALNVAAPITKSVIIAGNKERILVVDDEPAVLNIVRRFLELLGYTVDEFTDPCAALESFAKKAASYHLVFTDFAMPGMNGIDLAQRIRALRTDIPIILCTGFGGAVNEEATRLVGITQVVNKPYQKQTIADAISAAVKEQAGRSVSK